MTKFIRQVRIEGNIAYVPLTREYEAIIDAADLSLVNSYNWYAKVCKNTVYAVRTDRSESKQRDVYMHRVIMGEPGGFDVDHLDRNGLNNSRKNLRQATKAQNQHNAGVRSDNTSGFKGVGFYKHTAKWVARIRICGKQKHIGYYDSPEQAHAAYCKASAKYHGDFGRVEQ